MIKFGTGGWRAIIGDDFTKANVQTLSQAIADEMLDTGCDKIVIGYDRRFLSDVSAKWAAEVFAARGIIVYFINVDAPTPMIMYGVKTMEAKYGMAVTASHNPASYNGIKVFTEGGRDAAAEVTQLFEARIEKGVNVKSVEFEKGLADGTIKIFDIANEYIDSILGMIDIDRIKKRRMKVLLDPMFGVSRTSLQTILMTARCDVDTIHDRHDTLFGGRLPAPTAKTLTRLRDMVVEGGYDIGIATDGDADRIGIIDDRGNFIHPNQILALLYYYLTKYKGWEGDCVRNIATTHLLDRIAESFGKTCHEVPVGFKHISAKMEESDALIGGESSGGLTIRGHIKGKDGIFASALLVEMICVTGKKLSEILEEIYVNYGKREMFETDYSFSNEKKAELQKMLFEEKKLPELGVKVARVSYMDGLKIYFENDGWIIARFSGTEPLIRIFCEMGNMEEAQRICLAMRDFLGL
ncbi:MAG: phosphoglucomutase/phosphomannomutase family protein [Ruminococcaceae bacterium]|nr:phosphoglucomutase/phosphomannomutase family protein [Oscillospiraceae bacterium]